jgi:hypothetical protein
MAGEDVTGTRGVPGGGAGVARQSVASARMNRWVILAGYALLTACTQLLWLAYAPITTQTHRIMGVSTGTVGDLASYRPDPAASTVYDQLFGEFTGLYRRNRKAHARLNRDRAHA